MSTATLEPTRLADLEVNLRNHVWTLMRAGFVDAAVCLIQADAIVAAHALVYDTSEDEPDADSGGEAGEGSPAEVPAEGESPEDAPTGESDESNDEAGGPPTEESPIVEDTHEDAELDSATTR